MVSIIIVNYRSWAYLSECLQPLIHLPNIELIVVDNNSNDNEINENKNKFKNVIWIESALNLGFGKACNLGASNAKGDFLLFLNPDTIANEAAINGMKLFLNQNLAYKIVSCKQHSQLAKHFLLFPSPSRIFGIFRSIEVKLNTKKFIVKKLNKVHFIEPDWVSGSVVFMSKAWFNEIGGWSEEFWMYSEDVDICKKSGQNNGKIALLTEVEIYHKHGGASRKNIEITAMAKTEVIKSKHVYIQKYFKGFGLIFSHVILILDFVFLKAFFALMGSLFFFVPKLKLQQLIFENLFKYYIYVFKNNSWFSEKIAN
jgi:GT2 family glycosyltransferase